MGLEEYMCCQDLRHLVCAGKFLTFMSPANFNKTLCHTKRTGYGRQVRRVLPQRRRFDLASGVVCAWAECPRAPPGSSRSLRCWRVLGLAPTPCFRSGEGCRNRASRSRCSARTWPQFACRMATRITLGLLRGMQVPRCSTATARRNSARIGGAAVQTGSYLR
jgi:hypothetical protein